MLCNIDIWIMHIYFMGLLIFLMATYIGESLQEYL